jgi:FAD/FMN-containing dehydrogenase
LLAPVYAVTRPDDARIDTLPYWDAQEILSEQGDPEFSHERSRFVKGALSAEAIRTILANLEAWPGTHVAATWKFFLMGGRIDAKRPAEMAFVHRGASMISSIELEWAETDSAETLANNQAWLTGFHDAMERYTTPYCYQNFIDPSQPGYLDAYYGENLPRLREVKRRYDPTDLFRYPQSIPV